MPLLKENILFDFFSFRWPGNKLEGDWGEIVALGAEISP